MSEQARFVSIQQEFRVHKKNIIVNVHIFVENSCKACGIPVSKDVTRTPFPLTGNLSICKKLCVCSGVVAAGPNLLKTSEVVFGLLKKQMSNITKLTIACSFLKNSKPKCMQELPSALNLMVFLEFSHNLTIITANEKKKKENANKNPNLNRYCGTKYQICPLPEIQFRSPRPTLI